MDPPPRLPLGLSSNQPINGPGDLFWGVLGGAGGIQKKTPIALPTLPTGYQKRAWEVPGPIFTRIRRANTFEGTNFFGWKSERSSSMSSGETNAQETMDCIIVLKKTRYCLAAFWAEMMIDLIQEQQEFKVVLQFLICGKRKVLNVIVAFMQPIKQRQKRPLFWKQKCGLLCWNHHIVILWVEKNLKWLQELGGWHGIWELNPL